MSVGILLSTYNGEKYIINQLDSIKAQDYIDYNLYIADDCSTDNTFHTIEKYIKDNNLTNWFLSKNECNLGWKKSFMTLIDRCQEDYIFLCDQDDYWLSDKISVMMKIMESNEEIDLLCSQYLEFYNDYEIGQCRKEKTDYNVRRIENNRNMLKIDYPGCTYCFRRSISKQAIALWKEYLPHDAALWISAFLNHKLFVLDHPLIYWRQHKESVYGGNRVRSTTGERHQFIKQYLDFFMGLAEVLNKQTNSNKSNEKRNKRLIKRYIKWLKYRYKFVIEHRYSYLFRLMKNFDLYPTAQNLAGDIIDSLKRKKIAGE